MPTSRLHALTDALLGAIADGDIGQHFPNTDPRWKGAPSHLFLAEAARRVAERGGQIANVDVTILCEAPKIAPHRQAMRMRIAEILGIDVGSSGREGHHHRGARLHGPPRGDCRHGHGHRRPAVAWSMGNRGARDGSLPTGTRLLERPQFRLPP